MQWKNILDNWKNGIVFNYPSSIKERFEWNTSVLQDNGNVEYKEKFRINNNLLKIQNFDAFNDYIIKSKNKYVVAFPNLNSDTMLVIPMPRKNKNYVTLKDFIDNSSALQQKFFWKKVVQVAKQFMKKHENIWISVHGLGVPYTHIRISCMPKYYFDNELKKI